MAKKLPLDECLVKTLDVNTSMIPEGTEEALRSGYELQRVGLTFDSVLGGGWMIAVPWDAKTIKDVNRRHVALGFLLEFCSRNRIGYLKLDWRAPELEGFTTFNWKDSQ